MVYLEGTAAIQTWCQCESETDRGFADDYMLDVKGKRGLGYATHGVQQLGSRGCNIKFNTSFCCYMTTKKLYNVKTG